MRPRSVYVTGVFLVVLFASTTAAAATHTGLLASGNFEYPRLNGAPSRSYKVGQHVGAWDVTGPVAVVPAVPPFETPPVGSQLIQLRPFLQERDGEICQTISGMVPHSEYVIRLLAATVLGESTITVTLGRTAVATVDLTDTTFPAVFILYEWTVTAPSSSARLCLRGHPVSRIGYALVDAVRVHRAGVLAGSE